MFKHFKELKHHIYLLMAVNYRMFGYYENAVRMCHLLLKETHTLNAMMDYNSEDQNSRVDIE